MNRHLSAALVAVSICAGSASFLTEAQASEQSSAAGSTRMRACALLTKDEVKKHLPWMPMFDQMSIEEEPIGAAGSSCEYPSVGIQVMPFSQRMIDWAREKGGLETVSGIGDDAYFHNNRDLFAELDVKTGKYLVTLQAGWDGKNPAVKAGVLNLAKSLVAKLR